jgi:ATP-binding cassette subfamily F protein 3
MTAAIEMPRGTRLGYIAQEAPSGDATPFETVLAADTERAALLAESETCTIRTALADVHERLIAIDAIQCPRARRRILSGWASTRRCRTAARQLSGGWKMRVALAALLFSSPICCCSTNRRTTSISKRLCGWKISSNPIRP